MQSSEPGGGERPKACRVRPIHIRCFCGHYYWDPYNQVSTRSKTDCPGCMAAVSEGQAAPSERLGQRRLARLCHRAAL